MRDYLGRQKEGRMFKPMEESNLVTMIDDETILLKLSKEFYEKEAVFASAHKFNKKCSVEIKPIEEKYVGIYLRLKDKKALSDIAKDLYDGIIDHQLRRDLEKEFGAIRELIVRHAFFPVSNLQNEIQSNTK